MKIDDTPEFQAMVHRLYSGCPGAEPPPRDETGTVCWGDVAETEHYVWCEQIAREIINAAQAYSK